MLFKAKYNIESNNTRYDCLKRFLSVFHDLNQGYEYFDDEKELFGYCEEGEFTFKTNTPASLFYNYLPKTKIKFIEKDGKSVMLVVTKSFMLRLVFCIFALFALLFALEAILLSNTRFYIITAVCLALAFVTAFLSSRQIAKIKAKLKDLMN